MYNKRISVLFLCLILSVLLAGCWSSREIENLALYSGLALDIGQPAPVEKDFEQKGNTYSKQNKVMITAQIVPIASPNTKDKQKGEPQTPYYNISGSGDSILEIFREFTTRLDRPIIGYHLKIIVLSSELLKKQSIGKLTDFLLRDNHIRPSTMLFISQGSAKEILESTGLNKAPSFHIMDMRQNQSRTSKVLSPVTLSNLSALMHSKKSFVLQNIVTGGGESEFSGAGIIKGSSGHWIGTLSEEDTECLSWMRNKGKAGVIKTYDWENEPITYEIKSMKSKISSMVKGDNISFNVAISTEGRLIETWNQRYTSSSRSYTNKVGQLFEKKLAKMMQELIRKLQSEYKADVAGFGDKLAIEHPAAWKKVKEHWDETFSRSEVTVTYDLKITDFGAFTK